MNYLTMSIILPVLLLIGAGYLHIANLRRIYGRIEALKGAGESISREEFFREMSQAQGSNFSSLAMAAWMMLFVALAYLYFLVPGNLPVSYMVLMPEWASSPFGFFIFGIIVAGSAAVIIFLVLDKMPESHRDIKLTELYSFYIISKSMKRYIGLTVPLLGFSVLCSAYIGTICPKRDPLFELLGFASLMLSATILVLPILAGRR